jgi:hypothetical protein
MSTKETMQSQPHHKKITKWKITNTKTPLKVVETPNYHKNIALHNLQETKQNKTNHSHFPFPSPSITKSFVMFYF